MQLLKLKLTTWIFFAFLVFNVFNNYAYAWMHEVAFNFGNSVEPEKDYHNTYFGVSGKFYKFKVDNTLYATIDGTIAHWHADTDENNELINVAISPALRAYFANPLYHTWRPYLGVSVGPTYISAEELGTQVQNTHFALQSTLETGMEIGNNSRSVDVNMHLVHICNAGLVAPNEGYDLLYVFSIGYQF